MLALAYLFGLAAICGAIFSLCGALEHAIPKARAFARLFRRRGAVRRYHTRRSWPTVDYSEKRARALEQLGDDYLLARPVNRKPAQRDSVVLFRQIHTEKRARLVI